jgi:hypothetical protein
MAFFSATSASDMYCIGENYIRTNLILSWTSFVSFEFVLYLLSFCRRESEQQLYVSFEVVLYIGLSIASHWIHSEVKSCRKHSRSKGWEVQSLRRHSWNIRRPSLSHWLRSCQNGWSQSPIKPQSAIYIWGEVIRVLLECFVHSLFG